ncbi:MAG: LPS export ABC transporter ATP-binding protein [Gammaproteobacteria bacterium]|nr:LPS export ABC transporter ATP-binding protein [Gammaproteobacteria bacterium]MDH3858703.1 LPS export ABC transporter ATP-binding protein [Gammaproteobacteria bacterium]
MSNTNLLKATGLAKAYQKREVVRSVSLQVAAGEIVGLLGPNGAGKTTCFYMIVGLINNDAGTIHLNDKSIDHLPMHLRARLGIGYLPQEASVFRSLTVAQNIMAILQLRKDLDKAARNQMLEQLMEEFQIEHLRDTDGISLSGGERRRVEIARALANQPEFILLDEPFAGVDPISVIDIQSIIRQLATRGIGVLITDHNVRETLGICDRAYVMGNGEVLAEGNPSQILDNKIVRKIYLGDDFKL